MSGSAQRALSGDGYAHETLTVDNTAGGKGFTTSTWQSGGDFSNVAALVTNRGRSVSYTYDGTTVTSTVGHLLQHGDQIKVEGQHNIIKFKAIALTSSENGTLDVTFERIGG